MFLYGMACLLFSCLITEIFAGFHSFFKEKDGLTELTFDPSYTILIGKYEMHFAGKTGFLRALKYP